MLILNILHWLVLAVDAGLHCTPIQPSWWHQAPIWAQYIAEAMCHA